MEIMGGDRAKSLFLDPDVCAKIVKKLDKK